MRRSTLALVTLSCLLIAGCTGGPPGSPAGSPTPSAGETPTLTPTPSGFSPTEGTATYTTPKSPTATDSTATGSLGGETIEYVLRPGSIPEGFASVNATFRVVFVDRIEDFGPCYPEVFSGPYKPTITPIRTPAGECHRSEPITVDLADPTGDRSLGNFTAPESASGHALLLTDLVVTRENGTTVEAIKGIGGLELVATSEVPAGPVGIELGIESPPGERDYDYWVVTDRFDPRE